jgi:hypothetical protein
VRAPKSLAILLHDLRCASSRGLGLHRLGRFLSSGDPCHAQPVAATNQMTEQLVDRKFRVSVCLQAGFASLIDDLYLLDLTNW